MPRLAEDAVALDRGPSDRTDRPASVHGSAKWGSSDRGSAGPGPSGRGGAAVPCRHIVLDELSAGVVERLDPDTAAYIEELEQRADTLADEADLPSGDALAAELTRFLRERERENGDDDVARGQ